MAIVLKYVMFQHISNYRQLVKLLLKIYFVYVCNVFVQVATEARMGHPIPWS